MIIYVESASVERNLGDTGEMTTEEILTECDRLDELYVKFLSPLGDVRVVNNLMISGGVRVDAPDLKQEEETLEQARYAREKAFEEWCG